MIKIENLVVPSPEQMKMVILGARNSFSSREKSDSVNVINENGNDILIIGPEDKNLLMRLSHSSSAEGKFMRMMHLVFDMTAPLYFWKQFDTYKIGTVANSESTMHTISKNPIDISDFSVNLDPIARPSIYFNNEPYIDYYEPEKALRQIVDTLEYYRKMFLETHNKMWWDLLIAMLPESYNQKRTIDINYQALLNIMLQRHGHKLPEWREFINTFLTIPYSFLLKGY